MTYNMDKLESDAPGVILQMHKRGDLTRDEGIIVLDAIATWGPKCVKWITMHANPTAERIESVIRSYILENAGKRPGSSGIFNNQTTISGVESDIPSEIMHLYQLFVEDDRGSVREGLVVDIIRARDAVITSAAKATLVEVVRLFSVYSALPPQSADTEKWCMGKALRVFIRAYEASNVKLATIPNLVRALTRSPGPNRIPDITTTVDSSQWVMRYTIRLPRGKRMDSEIQTQLNHALSYAAEAVLERLS